MPEPTRRKHFQIHLSTAIVMMFAAGALIWANVQPARLRVDVIEKVRTDDVELQGSDYQYEIWGNGWPVALHRRFDDTYIFKSKPNYVQSSTHYTDYKMVALDFGAALLILFAVWYACEWLIRRRARRSVNEIIELEIQPHESDMPW